MSRQTRIVVVGAGYAGLLAALRLDRGRHRLPMDITLVNAGEEFVERIRFHQQISGQKPRRWPLRQFLEGTGINFVEATVRRLDPGKQELTMHTSAGERQLSYDRLIYALGSRPVVPLWGDDETPTLAVGDPDDVNRLRRRVQNVAANGGRVVVVGGGLTGIETATELAESYPSLPVTLITSRALGAGLSGRAQSYLRRALDRLNVEVREHTRVDAVASGRVQLAGGDSMPAELCVWAGPMRGLPLAADAGLPVNEAGQVIVDSALRSVATPNIFAAGDAACVQFPGGQTVRMACATAMPLGAHAADNVIASISGRDVKPFRFRYLLQCISLGRNDGIIQMVRGDDTPTDRVVTGRRAAWIKEQVCRSTVMFLRWQRRGIGSVWPRGRISA